MANAQSKFKFKDLSLLAVFTTAPDVNGVALIKVGKTSAVRFNPSEPCGTDTLTYVYPQNTEKVRLKREAPVYALSKRLLVSLDFNAGDEEDEDSEVNSFKEIPHKGAKSARNKIKVKPNGAKLVDPGVTAKACDAAEMELESDELGPLSVNNAIFHPHPQPGTQDAGMSNPAAAKKVTKKAIRKPTKVKKAVKGQK